MKNTQSILAGLTAVGDSNGHFGPTVVPNLNQFKYKSFRFSEKNRSEKGTCETPICGFGSRPRLQSVNHLADGSSPSSIILGSHAKEERGVIAADWSSSERALSSRLNPLRSAGPANATDDLEHNGTTLHKGRRASIVVGGEPDLAVAASEYA